MASRYFDNRVHPHFTPIYSKVPYLDTQIFNLETDIMRESRRRINRTDRAINGLARTLEKSVKLENTLERSRIERDRSDYQYTNRLAESKNTAITKANETWRNYLNDTSQKRVRQINEQAFLGSRLYDSNRRAYQRLQSVRRWL